MKTLVNNSETVDRLLLEQQIKNMYENVARDPGASYHFRLGKDLAIQLGYRDQYLSKIPAQSVASFAGVGYHFDLAELKAGESVVDLGSGSGMDVFYAAMEVGPKGQVIGIDMTNGQLRKSETLQKNSGYAQARFLKGYIEEIPVASNSVDVVITNGVINLSNDKPKVFHEIARILKPTGRLALSDIVSTKSFPHQIKCNPNLWAACVAGAMRLDLYQQLITSCGMHVEREKLNPYQFISDKAQGATKNYGIRSISLLATKT
jgi:ubiquinone/menaquinone biosynthesis C-methylase UbiE